MRRQWKVSLAGPLGHAVVPIVRAEYASARVSKAIRDARARAGSEAKTGLDSPWRKPWDPPGCVAALAPAAQSSALNRLDALALTHKALLIGERDRSSRPRVGAFHSAGGISLNLPNL